MKNTWKTRFFVFFHEPVFFGFFHVWPTCAQLEPNTACDIGTPKYPKIGCQKVVISGDFRVLAVQKLAPNRRHILDRRFSNREQFLNGFDNFDQKLTFFSCFLTLFSVWPLWQICTHILTWYWGTAKEVIFMWSLFGDFCRISWITFLTKMSVFSLMRETSYRASIDFDWLVGTFWSRCLHLKHDIWYTWVHTYYPTICVYIESIPSEGVQNVLLEHIFRYMVFCFSPGPLRA